MTLVLRTLFGCNAVVLANGPAFVESGGHLLNEFYLTCSYVYCMKRLLLFLSLLPLACLAQQDSCLIFENGQYFNGKEFRPFKQLIVKNGKILEIGKGIKTVAGKKVDLAGKYVIPGLTDAHVHIQGSPTATYVAANAVDNLKSSLHCGVTTVVDLFASESLFKSQQATAAAAPAKYAYPYMAGPILTVKGGHGTEFGIPTRCLVNVADAGQVTNEVIDHGADVIKLVYDAYSGEPSITREMLFEIVKTAHKRGKKVFAHINKAEEAMDCADAGVDVLAHMPANKLSEEQVEKLRKAGIIIIPTIVVQDMMITGYSKEYISDPLLWQTANPVYMTDRKKEKYTVSPTVRQWSEKHYGSLSDKENLRNCIKAGIPILAGTDAGNPATYFGYSLHYELDQYVQAGMTNAAAIRSATEVIEMVMPETKTGKIKAGYWADIVVLNADPLKNISATKNIYMVVHRGQVVDDKEVLFPQAASTHVPLDATLLDIARSDKLPPNVATYTDGVLGGKSEVDCEIKKEAEGKRFLHMAGKIVPTGFIMFGGVAMGLGEEELDQVNLSGYTSISFDVKGNGRNYFFRLQSAEVKDYNYHSQSFKTSGEWQTVTIEFNKLEQSPYFGKKISLDLKTITSICFEATEQMNVNLDIKNIRLNQ